MAAIEKNGRQMLFDILQMPSCNRAWRSWAARISKWGKLELDIDVDGAYDALYADRGQPDTWQEEEKKRIAELEDMADAQMKRPMEDVLGYLAAIRSEAIEFGQHNANGFLWIVYRHIAMTCQNAWEWLDALIARSAPSDFLSPFVDRLSLDGKRGHEAALTRMLQCEACQVLAINRILRQADPNDVHLSIGLDLLKKEGLAESLYFWDSAIPVEIMARLLMHPNPAVRAVAALGEWQCEPIKTIRASLEAQWRMAVREIDPNHYALTEILGNDRHLAFEWFQSQLRSKNRPLALLSNAFHDACTALDKEQRRELLQLFTRKNYCDDLFDFLIGEHIDLFADWLDFQSDEYLRLRPLDRNAGARWEQMALLALDAGVSPDDLAEHCTAGWWGSGFGPLSQEFLAHIAAYEALASHPDPRLHPAGKRGLSLFQSLAKSELERERREEAIGD